ncbi:protein translocase subunit yidC [Limnobacter thiooxidans]|uniref:Membrane protein insertase YidC n=1 Tax=Limnobacter thiooxidans TaxID=131080 RepID=A0AA86J4P6_9BURK|nr:protein translocase subunit yidC [Limnobacter thiooxidans]BET27691.1 membrane protein insertase YidC [Limnobacter thiooxidans]
METRRLVLLMIFSLSLIMLWDNYQASVGKPTLFGLSTATSTANDKGTLQTPGSAAAVNDLPQAAAQSAGDVPADPNAIVETATAPAPAAQTVVVKTDVLELQFSTQGAQLVGSKLLNHPAAENPELPVQLFEQSTKRTYLGQAGLVGVPDAPNHRTLFELVSTATEFPAGQDSLKLVFKASSGGIESTYTYTVYKNRYDLDLVIQARNANPEPVTPSAYVQITRDGNPLESDSSLYATFTGPAVYTPEKKYQKIKFDDIADRSAQYIKTTDAGWLAMVQHYFVSAVIGQEGPRENYTRQVDANLYSIGLVSALGSLAPEQTGTYSAKLYTGPQDQRVLEALSPGLGLVVDYGWLTVIAQPIYWLLEKIHSYIGNWGWAIVVLTIFIKLVFFPLSAASYRSMAKMRKVGPRMQKLKEQYGDDKMGFQRAMMEMYKREKINPLGGCMPILVQIPVFIALYWVLLASVEMRNAPWLGWVTDLAAPDPFYILPVLMAVTMFIQTRLNPTPPDPIQAKVMMVMPLVFSVMFIFFPAGLVLYWVVNNILSIAQQWVITRQIESAPATTR